MEVKYLNVNEYDRWDNFVDNSSQGFIFSKSWWIDILTNGDFKICVLENSEEIFAGIILPFFSSKKINMPLLTQSNGILFKKMDEMRMQKKLTNEKEYTNLIIEFIEKDFNEFNMNFHYNYTFWLPLFWKGYNQTTRYTYLIDYSTFVPSEEFKSFSKGHKWTLNKVEKKSDLVVEEIYNVEEFYIEAKKTYERQNLKIGYSLDLLKKLHNELSKNNNGIMFKIIDSNKNIHAANYFVFNGQEAYYWLGASDENFRNEGGHTYLIWYAINYFNEKSKVFNFGGSMIEQVERNFRNFSAHPQQYFNICKRKSNKIYFFKKFVKEFLNRGN